MNLLDIQTQLEEELTWRLNEIRFLKNQVTNIRNESEKKIYRKALIVMLYSHFEGFSKTAFLIYINAINQEQVKRIDANDYITTASLAEIFKAYENKDKKCKVFKNSLPSDEKLHHFARQVDLVIELNDLWNCKVEIPESIVDVESNLKPMVLRKLLYRLGFPYNIFQKHEGLINHLINLRNSIAHGVYKSGLDDKEYNDIEKSIFDMMSELKKIIIEALTSRLYLKRAATSGT